MVNSSKPGYNRDMLGFLTDVRNTQTQAPLLREVVRAFKLNGLLGNDRWHTGKFSSVRVPRRRPQHVVNRHIISAVHVTIESYLDVTGTEVEATAI